METTAEDIERVRGLEFELLRPEARRSVEWLSSTLADDFLELGSSGKQYRKDDILSMLPLEEETQFSVSDFRAQVASEDTILVMYRVEKTRGGKQTPSLRTSLWRKRQGTWQMVFHQGTPVQKES